MLVDSPQDSFLGKSYDSGFRARENAVSPASGVRSAQGMLLEPGGGPLAGPRRRTLRPEPEAPTPSRASDDPAPPLRAPPARQAFESEFEVLETPAPLVRRSDLPAASDLFAPVGGSDLGLTPLTRVSAPDPTLLALTRGTERAEPRRRFYTKWLFWFAFGIAFGTGIAWVAVSDVSAEVYSARVWAAGKLRSIRVHAEAESAPVASGVVLDSAPAIPTVDVTQLPKAREEQPPSQVPGVAPAPAPPAPGAPALQHAPGPR